MCQIENSSLRKDGDDFYVVSLWEMEHPCCGWATKEMPGSCRKSLGPYCIASPLNNGALWGFWCWGIWQLR
jgi:hypothetical protein